MALPSSVSRKKTKLVAAGVLAAFFLISLTLLLMHELNSSGSHKNLSLSKDVTLKAEAGATSMPTINSQTTQNTITPTPTVTTSDTPSTTPTIPPTISDSNNIETYSDAKISFHHIVKDNYYTYGTKVDGNRIYVYPTYLSSYKQGSFIELFKKDPSDNIQQAIPKSVLQGYNIDDCPIGGADTIGVLPSNVTAVTMRYNSDNLMLGAPDAKDPTKCPDDYAETEGPKYFTVDANHPDLLIFYSVANGLYPANSTGNTTWFQSLTFNY